MSNDSLRPILRSATIADSEPLAHLTCELGYATTPEQMRARLSAIADDRRQETLVLELEGRVIGYAGVQVRPAYHDDHPRGQIIVLMIDQQFRSRGLGGMLLEGCEAWLRQQGAETISLTSNKRRTEAHRFYEQRGWDKSGFNFKKTLPLKS